MTRYYLSDPSAERGFEEITKEEWDRLINEPPVSEYANKVYCGKITLEDVPEEYREETEVVVNNKIAKWGLYKDQTISDSEFTDMVEGVL